MGHVGDWYNFGRALAALRDGRRVSREGWNGKGMWIALREPPQVLRRSEMTRPYIYMSTAQGDLVPWVASQTDLLATDWQVLDD